MFLWLLLDGQGKWMNELKSKFSSLEQFKYLLEIKTWMSFLLKTEGCFSL